MNKSERLNMDLSLHLYSVHDSSWHGTRSLHAAGGMETTATDIDLAGMEGRAPNLEIATVCVASIFSIKKNT